MTTTQNILPKNPPLRFKDKNGNDYPDWVEKRLGTFSEKIESKLGKKNIPSYSISAGIGFVSHMDKWGKDNAGKSKEKYLRVKQGEFVYNKGNSKKYPYGCTYLLSHTKEIAVPNVFIAFSVKSNIVVSKFLEYFFILGLHNKHLMKYITSGARSDGLLNLNKDDFFKIIVSLPHLNEQKKIADFLSLLDSRIDILWLQYEGMLSYKRGMMQQIFSQTIRFKDKNGNNYPDWAEKRLGDIALTQTGESNREDSTETGLYHFFDRSTDIRASAKYLFDTEAIIVGGEGKDFIPKYFVGKFDLHQRAYATTCFNKNHGKFVYYWLYHYRRYFLKMSVGSTMPSLRMNAFTTFPIFIPHPKEQTKIANFLSAIDTKIETLKSQITQTKLFKKAIMQQMFV